MQLLHLGWLLAAVVLVDFTVLLVAHTARRLGLTRLATVAFAVHDVIGDALQGVADTLRRLRRRRPDRR